MPESKGHLNPRADEVVFDRFELGAGLSELVRHVWVVRWAIPAGETRDQRVLAYPAFNAVIEPERAQLFGLDPRLDIHELSGTSWVVGVLFRPAAGSVLTTTPPIRLVGAGEALPGAPRALIAEIMGSPSDADASRRRLVDALARWLTPLAGRLDERALLVNQICQLAETDVTITRVEELAERVGLGSRTLERLVKGQLGVTPKWLIECRRLQQAAHQLRSEPSTELTALAIELGYSDYAHFSRRYKAVLGETPASRGSASGGP